jgi:hypothetical protein
MGIYANVGGNQLTQFHLARVPSAAAGRTLVLNFFDIGDAPSQGSLQIVPPADSNIGSTFTGCRWTTAPGIARGTPQAPWGSFAHVDDCLITGVNDVAANWNGQWSTITIPIPANYTCNDQLHNGEPDPQGCWVKINYLFAGGISDSTSWQSSFT